MATRLLLAYSASRYDRRPYLYRGDYGPKSKIAFIAGPGYISTFAGSSAGL